MSQSADLLDYLCVCVDFFFSPRGYFKTKWPYSKMEIMKGK